MNTTTCSKDELTQSQLIRELAGGFSQRTAQAPFTPANLIIPIARSTKRLVEALADSRGFCEYHIWERIEAVIQNGDIDVIRVDSKKEMETVSVDSEICNNLIEIAKRMNVPIEDLINRGVIKLIGLLHIVDDEEYKIAQKIEPLIQNIKHDLEGVVDFFQNEWYNSSIGLYGYLHQADNILNEALKVIETYLNDHAVSQIVSLENQSEFINRTAEVINYDHD